MPNHPLTPGFIEGFCTAIDAAIDAALRGSKPPPREKRSDPPAQPSAPPDEPMTNAEYRLKYDPPSTGPLIGLPYRARKAFHQAGIKTIKQLKTAIVSGKLDHRTYSHYGRTTHKAVLKALKIQPKCPHCGQTLQTK